VIEQEPEILMNSKKVLLIVPPRTVNSHFLKYARIATIPPVGLMYIAGELERWHYQVKIMDCLAQNLNAVQVGHDSFRYGMTDEEILHEIKTCNPDYIGISCMYTMNHTDLISLCSLIKANFVAPIVAGGAHVTAEWSRILDTGTVDFAVLGEGEHSFRDLLLCLDNDRNPADVEGVAYSKDGKARANLPFRHVDDLDALPLPAYHLVDFAKYMGGGRAHGDTTSETNWAPIITSRGCPHRCSFCAGRMMGGDRLRLRSVANIMEEIKFLKLNYNVGEIHVEDDNFAHNLQRAVSILKKTSELGLKLAFPNGLSLYSLSNDEIVRYLKKNHVISVTVAIESGDEFILKNVMRKPVTLSLAKRVVKKLKSNGINVKAFFVLGMPGESVDSLRNTFKLIRELGLDWSAFNAATPLPGTQLAQLCLNNNFINEEVAANLERVNFSESVIDTPSLSHFQVDKYLYYFNIMTNFIDPIAACESGQALDYKLLMYSRVMRQVPEHRYAGLSLARVQLCQVARALEKTKGDHSEEIESLSSANSALKQKQLTTLLRELDDMDGDIVLFHTESETIRVQTSAGTIQSADCTGTLLENPIA
jgi:anaerobic magnesium-protoporphyrin IX monomethyl ester cyclase